MDKYVDLRRLSEIDEILAVLLFGSEARGESITRDIDVCIVAPEAKDRAKLLLNVFFRINNPRYDIWLFEELPLYMKAEVVKNHKILWCRDLSKLYSYFADFMRIWRDQEIRIRIYTNELLGRY